MSEKMQSAMNSLVLWKAALLECFLKCMMTMGGAFIASASAFKSKSDWDAMWWLPKAIFFIGIFMAGVGVIQAFMSNTVATIRAKVEAGETDTQLINNPHL